MFFERHRHKAYSFSNYFLVIVLYFSTFWKIYPIIGRSGAFFSVSDFGAPLFGQTSLIYALGYFFLKTCSLKISLWWAVALHLPACFGMFAWRYNHWILHLFVPAVCGGLFWIHPVGHTVFMYAFYWLIPMVIYGLRNKNIYLNALAVSFVVHAVGTLVYLYGAVLGVADIQLLLPRVFIERCGQAAVMVLVVSFCSNLSRLSTLFIRHYYQRNEQSVTGTVTKGTYHG